MQTGHSAATMESALLSPANEAVEGKERPAAMANWLLAVAAIVFAILVVGGITRLTESGLSITEWKPVSGVIPPLSNADWQHAFDLYKTTTQYKEVTGPAAEVAPVAPTAPAVPAIGNVDSIGGRDGGRSTNQTANASAATTPMPRSTVGTTRRPPKRRSKSRRSRQEGAGRGRSMRSVGPGGAGPSSGSGMTASGRG